MRAARSAALEGDAACRHRTKLLAARPRISGTLSRKIAVGSIFTVTVGFFRERTAFRDAGFACYP
jgi:hypothetical protein